MVLSDSKHIITITPDYVAFNYRGRGGKGISNTILAESSMGVAVKREEKLRVRRLTPGECFRLMVFTLADARLLSSHGISNTQLYHMAGNSIVVDVLMEIFKKIYKVEG